MLECPAAERCVDAGAEQLLGQDFVPERQSPKPDLRVRRVETRGENLAVVVDEICECGAGVAALFGDRSREDPGMAVGDHPLLPRLESEAAARLRSEEVHPHDT